MFYKIKDDCEIRLGETYADAIIEDEYTGEVWLARLDTSDCEVRPLKFNSGRNIPAPSNWKELIEESED